MTMRRYLADPALQGYMTIAEIVDGEHPVVRAPETWFYVQGGGQKADQGQWGGMRVLDVKPGADGTVDHFVDSIEGILPGQCLPFEVDAGRRLLNARLHSAGHLLSGVIEDAFAGTLAVAGHHWPGEGRVDFTCESVPDVAGREDFAAELVRRAIAADMPITIEGDPYVNRICRVGTYRPIPCGGLHVASTRTIGDFHLRSMKVKGGKLRIGYDLS